jgi:hypothetical protein
MATTKTEDKNPTGTAMRKMIALLNDLDDEQRSRVVQSLSGLYPAQLTFSRSSGD